MFPRGRTMIKRKRNKRNMGVKAKRQREALGTTASFPASGQLPSLRAGRKVSPESIVLPKK